MKIAYISTYPPRECGIAIFNSNLIRSIISNSDNHDIETNANVVAVSDRAEGYVFPPEVKFVIQQDRQVDYIDAANNINFSNSEVCILEHEFGIFGGESGIYILPLLHRLKVPLIAIFHTVLKEPDFTQRSIFQSIGTMAQKIVIMSNLAKDFLTDIYHIPQEKLVVIEHGVPDFEISSKVKMKKKFNLEGRKIILTFGLLSRNKGIETVIQALPKVVAEYPDVLYMVLGHTHPNILRTSGEEYRNYLNLLVKKLKLENHVYFNKAFVDEQTLFEYLSATDIYITPYINEKQITSGTLAYAVGAGIPVVSTPYWHAQELLAEERGVFFPFKDSAKLSDLLNHLFGHPQELKKLGDNAYEYGKHLKWKITGSRYLELARQVSTVPVIPINKLENNIDLSILTEFTFEHISRLTDNTGIIQHAKYGIPNFKEGYCLDDNSRALLMALMAYRQYKDKEALDLLIVYLSFVNYMQLDNGAFHNFLSFDKNYSDNEGSEDSFGRTIWALGYTIRYAPSDSYSQFARDIFSKASSHFDSLVSIRGIADTIIGICYYLGHFPDNESMLQTLMLLTKKLMLQYKLSNVDGWHWFENSLTYDNGILPLALFYASEIINNPEIKNIALESTSFLEKISFKDDYLSLVGSNGWYIQGGTRAVFAQQSVDAMAMVLLNYKAYQCTNNKEYRDKMFKSYMWFLGENELRIPLYDYETKGCCDGLESFGVNRNQGAESTLAYFISHLTVLDALESEFEMTKQFKSEQVVNLH